MQRKRGRHVKRKSDKLQLTFVNSVPTFGMITFSTSRHFDKFLRCTHISDYLGRVKVLCTVKDVMVTNVVTVDVGVNVRRAVERMNNQEIGCLVVLEKGNFAGILTDRDVLKRTKRLERGRPAHEVCGRA